jgi:hypothetical protein
MFVVPYILVTYDLFKFNWMYYILYLFVDNLFFNLLAPEFDI